MKWFDSFPATVLYLIMSFNQERPSMDVVLNELDMTMNDVIFANKWFEMADDATYFSAL